MDPPGTEIYHHVFRQWKHTPGAQDNHNNATGYYLRMPKSESWPDAWIDAWDERERYTRQNSGQTNSMSDETMIIDEFGDVHVAYEAKSYPDYGVVSTIGYKRRGVGSPQPLWGGEHLPVRIAAPAGMAGGTTPRFFLQRLTGADSLHLVFSVSDIEGGLDCDSGDGSRRRAHTAREIPLIGGSDTAWSPISVIQTEPPLVAFVVDDNSWFHFFDRQRIQGDNSCLFRVYHGAGKRPSGGGCWDLALTLVDEWPVEPDCDEGGIGGGAGEGGDGEDSASPVEIVQGSNDLLYFVWHSSTAAPGSAEIRLAQLDVTSADPEE